MTHKLTHTYTKLSINDIHTETTTDRKNENVPTQTQTHLNTHTITMTRKMIYKQTYKRIQTFKKHIKINKIERSENNYE